MSGRVAGPGGHDPRIGAADLTGVDGADAGAGGGTGSGAAQDAPGAARTARPRSLDMSGLGLASALEAKLGPAASGAVATGPATPAPRPPALAAASPAALGPRIHAGVADARAIEALIAKKDAVGMTNAILARARRLFVCDRAGLRLAPGATPGEVNRFKVFLDTLKADGKLGDFRKLLSEAPPSSVLLDGKPLGFGVNADDILDLLVRSHGGRAIQQTWAATPPPPTPPNAGLVDAQVIEACIDAGDAAGAANELIWRARALFTLDAGGVHIRPNAKPGEVARFQQMLTQLESHGKIPDLRQLLGRAASLGIQVDGEPLPSGVTPDDIGNALVHAFGSQSQQLRWDRAPPL